MTASDESHAWVSTEEAARRLAVSESTIRRWITTGRVMGEKEPRGPNDTRDRYRVWLPKAPPERADASSSDHDASVDNASTSDIELALIAELTNLRFQHAEERLVDAQRMQEMEREAGRLQARLDDAQQSANEAISRATSAEQQAHERDVKLAGLSARNDALVADNDRLVNELAEARRPWWQKIFG